MVTVVQRSNIVRDRLAAPSPFTFEGKLSGKWKTWECGFDFYMCVTESNQNSDKIKASILLTCIGERGREIYETFDFANAADKLKLDPILQKFKRSIVIQEAIPL